MARSYAAYVVFVGSEPGVYYDWDEVGRRTVGVKGAIQKGYATRIEAEEAFERACNAGNIRTVRTDRRSDETAAATSRAQPRPAPGSSIRSDETVKASPTKSEAVSGTLTCECHLRRATRGRSSPPTEVTQHEPEMPTSVLAQARHSPRRDHSSASVCPPKPVGAASTQHALASDYHENERTYRESTDTTRLPNPRRRRDSNSSSLSYVPAPAMQVASESDTKPGTNTIEDASAALATESREIRVAERTASDDGRLSSPPTDVSVTLPDENKEDLQSDIPVKPAMIAALSKGRLKPEPAGASTRISAQSRRDGEEPSSCKITVKDEPDGAQTIQTQTRTLPPHQRTDSRAMRTKPLSQTLAKMDGSPAKMSKRDTENPPTRPASPAKRQMHTLMDSSSPKTEMTIREPLVFSPEPEAPTLPVRQGDQGDTSSPPRIRRGHTEPSVGHASPRLTRSRTHDIVVTGGHSSKNSSLSSGFLSPPDVPPGSHLLRVDRYWFATPGGDVENIARTRRWVQENMSAEHTRHSRDVTPPLSPNVTVRSPRSHRRREVGPSSPSDRVREPISTKSSRTAMPARSRQGSVHVDAADVGRGVSEHANAMVPVPDAGAVSLSSEPQEEASSTRETFETAGDFPSISTYTRTHRELSSGSHITRTSSELAARVAVEDGVVALGVGRSSSEPNLASDAQSSGRRGAPEGTAVDALLSISGLRASVSSGLDEAAAISLPLSPLQGLSLGPALQPVGDQDFDPRSPIQRGTSVPSRHLVFPRPSPGKSMSSLDSLLFKP